MKTSYTSILIAVFVMGLSACSKGTPTEGDARQVFENMTNQGTPTKTENLEFKSFKKINAQEIDISGKKAHVVEFEAEVSYRGATEVIKGEMIFEKTEKGWRGQDGNIY